MMVRKLLLAAAAATLAAAPVAVQAAGDNTLIGDYQQVGNLRFVIPVIAFAVLTGLLILLFDDNNERDHPVSP